MVAVLSRYDRHVMDVAGSNVLSKTTTYQMVPSDTTIYATTTAGAWTLTLPPVAECTGRMYTIRLVAGAAGGAAPNALTITHKGDSRRWGGGTFLRRPGHSVSFVSDGEQWHKMGRLLGAPNDVDNKYVYERFITPFAFGASAAAGVPSATVAGMIVCPDGNWFIAEPLGSQSLIGPAWINPGMSIAGDQAADEGYEIVGAHTFTVGTDPTFALRMRFSIADVSGTDDCAIGFRKVEATQANIDDYDEMAVVNVISGAIKIETILNGGATTTTDTTQTWADTATHTLTVFVSSAGVVTYQVDDAAPTATAAFTFDAGEVVAPFMFMLNDTDLAGAVTVLEWEHGTTS